MTPDHGGETDESPLRRWSRRKHAAQGRKAEPDEGTSDAAAPQSEDAAPVPASADEPATSAPAETTDADLPPVETLTPDSDYSQFMSPKVSDSLRQTALRKLFGLTQFNVRDGLDDYDEDYTQFRSLGDTVTADMRYHAERRAAKAREEQQASAEKTAADEPAAESAEPDADGAAEPGPAPPEARAASSDTEDGPDDRA